MTIASIRLLQASVVLAFLIMPSAVLADLAGEYKSQKWPGSKIVLREDGTAWYHYPRLPTLKRTARSIQLIYKEREITVEGKEYKMVGLLTSSRSVYKVFVLVDGDLLEYPGGKDTFVKDRLQKRAKR